MKRGRRPGATGTRKFAAVTEQLEDRSLLTVSTVFAVDTLTISFGAASDHAYISYDGSRIDVGTTEGGNDIYNGIDTITTLVIQDTAAAAGQIVTFSGSNTLTPITNITVTGIETAEVKQVIPTSAVVSGTASTVNVTVPGQLQDGIDLAASGATVNVGAGTFAEQLSVTKNLSLVGSSPSTTFIDGVSGVGVSIAAPATAVTLQNLTISGLPTAVVTGGATVTLTNTLKFDTGSAMTITGTDNGDSLRVVRNGSAVLTYLGATLVNTRTYSSLTSLVVNSGDGNDTFTVDLTGGNPIPSGGLTFNGGANTVVGDKLIVSGGSTTTVTHSFTNANDGSITLVGSISGTINYTQLEPITDNVAAVNRVLTFTGGAETITVSDSGGADGLTRIDSSLGESVDFTAPTTSLTIITNGGDAATISGLDAAFLTPIIVLQDTTAASTFSLGTSDVIPDTTSLTVVANAVLDLASFSDAIDGLTGTGTVNNSAGAGTLTVGASGASSTFSGLLSGTLALSKSGAGTLILTNGLNSYSGATTVNAGTLAVTANSALGAVGGNTIVGAAGTLDLRGVTYAAAEPVTLSGGTLQTSTGTSSFTGDINLTADSTVNVSGTQLTLSGQITGGAGLDIAKTGAGVLILTNGANTYSGDTNITAGSVQINGSNNGTGAVNVNNSSILRGIGTIAGTVNVNNTARLAPGIAGPGTLTMASVVFSTTAFLDIDLNGATPGTQYDQLVVSGIVNLGGANGATLTPTIGVGYDPATYFRFTIINQTGGGVVSGTFEGHPELGIYDVSGERLRVSYVESMAPYGNGNDVSLTVLPPPIVVTYTANGALRLEGTDLVDDITIDFSNTNSVTLIGNDYTNFIGTGTNGQAAGPYNVTGTITVNTYAANDRILLRGRTAGATLDSGDVTINLGADDDTLTTVDATLPTLGLTMTGSISVLGGLGNDTIRLGSNALADTFTALNVSLDTGAGPGAQSINLDRLTSNGNVTLANGGAGAQTVALGLNASNAPNSVRGNLIINQVATATSYSVGVRNTSVGGLTTITNGSGTGAAAVVIDTTTSQTVSGATSITNGNNATNAVTLVGTAGGLRLAGNVTVKNGIGTTSNQITVTDLNASGATSASFTNGASLSNAITFNGTLSNSFLGTVAATNGASTGTNVITATRLSATKGLTLTNGSATTSNAVTVGGSGTSVFGVTGNMVITNGNSADIDVAIDNLTVLGANAAGNLTISNGVTGAGGTTVTFGANALNSVSGNVQITNQNSIGTRAVVVNRTTVNGRTGFNLYQVGAGNTTLTMGNNQPTTIARGLVIQDGSGSSTVALQNLTVGSLNYTDIGGGVDILDLGGTPAGTLQVNGVTRIDTGAGSDIVRTGGAGGSAIYNDSVFISLGSGDDSLTIGANANCPAFSSNKFQFDGGAGLDTFTGSPMSLADYAPTTPLPKKVRSKITNFETLL